MTRITEHLADLEIRISAAAAESGRDAADIAILAVSKKHGVKAVQEAASAGLLRFAENYVQEALEKIPLVGPGLEWHFIGRIQSNKTRAIAENFDWVQTIATPRDAKRLSQQRPADMEELQVCIQVQLDSQGQHGGAPPADVSALCELVAGLPGLKLRGLMGIPLQTDSDKDRRKSFRNLHELMNQLKMQGHGLDTLSMGMTNDLEAAIVEGSTMIRIGTAIFGPRD